MRSQLQQSYCRTVRRNRQFALHVAIHMHFKINACMRSRKKYLKEMHLNSLSEITIAI